MALEIIEIVEDDHSQAKLLDQILRQASFRTNVAFDGPSGMQDVWRIKPALIIADDNLPGLNGREMCKRLRQDPSTKNIPIIVLSGFSSEERRTEALDGGADDFILKPYSATELLARVRAVLRRSRQEPAQDEDQIEDLTLTETLYVAIYRGTQMTLSAHEWKSLRRLASTVGMVVPREELKSLLWGDDPLLHDGELDRCIAQLNHKLGEGSTSIAYIKVLPGGFRLTSPDTDPSTEPPSH